MDADSSDESNNSSSSDDSKGSLEEKKNEIFSDERVIRMPMMFVKYWPSKELRNLWSDYLQMECIFSEKESLNSLFVATKIFQKNNLTFIKDRIEKREENLKKKLQ